MAADHYYRKRRRSLSQSASPRVHFHGQEEEDYSDSEISRSKTRRRVDLSVVVCKDFLRNLCKRPSIDCKFAHPHSSVSIEREKVTACADSLRNQCFRGRTCRYYHPPPHIQASVGIFCGVDAQKKQMNVDLLTILLLKAMPLSDFHSLVATKDQLVDMLTKVCQDFLRGKCERRACRYSHVSSHGDVEPEVCQDFLRGKCERKACRYSHVSTRGSNTEPEVCQDFLRGKCERRTCRYSHVSTHRNGVHQQYGAPTKYSNSHLESGNDHGTLPVCKDFLERKCLRLYCKYAHPDHRTEVNDGQVEVCRDFLRGVCRRVDCRFYHPSASICSVMPLI